MPLTPAPRGYPIKMVRDRTASIVNPSGEPGDLWYEKGEPETWLPNLKKKLGEEVVEYLISTGVDELRERHA